MMNKAFVRLNSHAKWMLPDFGYQQISNSQVVKKKEHAVSLNTIGSEYAKNNGWPKTGDKQKVLDF